MKLTLERVMLGVLAIAVILLMFKMYEIRVELEHIVSILMIVGAVWLIYQAYKAYKGASGGIGTRLFAAFWRSETIIVTRVQYALGLLLAFSETIATILGDPNVASALQQYTSPKVSGGLLVGSAVIMSYARRRRGSADPVVVPPLATATVEGPATIVIPDTTVVKGS